MTHRCIRLTLTLVFVASCGSEGADSPADNAAVDPADSPGLDSGPPDAPVDAPSLEDPGAGRVDPGAPPPDLEPPPDAPPMLTDPLTGCLTGAAPAGEGALGDVLVSEDPGAPHAADCGRVVWATPAGGLRLADLQSGAVWTLASDGAGADWPSLAGTQLVYAAGTPPQIYYRDLATASPGVAVDLSGHPQLRPRVAGGRIAWEDERTGHAQVRVATVGGQDAERIDPSDADQRFVALDGDRVLWTDFRDEDLNGVWDGDGGDQADIWTWTADGTVTPIVQAQWKQAFPELEGDRVVWLDWRDVPHDENGYPQPQPKLDAFGIFTGVIADGVIAAPQKFGNVKLGSYAGLPSLSNGWVAWVSDDRVYGSQIAAQPWSVQALTPHGIVARAPVMTEDRLVFRVDAELHQAPLPPL